MKKVICSGALTKDYFKCDERKCKHRKPHKPVKGRCGTGCKKEWEGDVWCVAPGTKSYLHIGEDGGLVSCIDTKEFKRKDIGSKECQLESYIRNKNICKKALENARDNYKIACKRLKELKKN